MMMMDGCGGMLLSSLLFLVLLVAGVALAVRAFRSGDRATGATGSSALQILDDRFARGEIDRDEYEERRRRLRS